MNEKKPEELIEELAGAEVVELEDSDLEDVAGGRLALEDDNGNCFNNGCCQEQ